VCGRFPRGRSAEQRTGVWRRRALDHHPGEFQEELRGPVLGERLVHQHLHTQWVLSRQEMNLLGMIQMKARSAIALRHAPSLLFCCYSAQGNPTDPVRTQENS
jgi:hypothetical protein